MPSIAPELRDRLLRKPDVRLIGTVNDGMLAVFLDNFEAALDRSEGEPLVELMTTGGDADTGYRIADEVRMAMEYRGVRPLFFGKTVVYSAGVTIMSAFPSDRRYLARNTTLLIHERRTEKQIPINGQVSASVRLAQETVSELNAAVRIQNDAFTSLVEGTNLTLDGLLARAANAWYVSAQEAEEHRLVAGLL